MTDIHAHATSCSWPDVLSFALPIEILSEDGSLRQRIDCLTVQFTAAITGHALFAQSQTGSRVVQQEHAWAHDPKVNGSKSPSATSIMGHDNSDNRESVKNDEQQNK